MPQPITASSCSLSALPCRSHTRRWLRRPPSNSNWLLDHLQCLIRHTVYWQVCSVRHDMTTFWCTRWPTVRHRYADDPDGWNALTAWLWCGWLTSVVARGMRKQFIQTSLIQCQVVRWGHVSMSSCRLLDDYENSRHAQLYRKMQCPQAHCMLRQFYLFVRLSVRHACHLSQRCRNDGDIAGHAVFILGIYRGRNSPKS